MLDADGSTDPAEIPGLRRAAARRAPTSRVGSRFASGRRHGRHGAAPQASGTGSLTRLVRVGFGTRLLRPLLRLHRVLARRVPVASTATYTGFEVETLIHIRALRAALRSPRCRASSRRGVSGSSNLRTFRDGLRVLKAIFAEWHRNRSAPVGKAPHHAPALRVVSGDAATTPAAPTTRAAPTTNGTRPDDAPHPPDALGRHLLLHPGSLGSAATGHRVGSQPDTYGRPARAGRRPQRRARSIACSTEPTARRSSRTVGHRGLSRARNTGVAIRHRRHRGVPRRRRRSPTRAGSHHLCAPTSTSTCSASAAGSSPRWDERTAGMVPTRVRLGRRLHLRRAPRRGTGPQRHRRQHVVPALALRRELGGFDDRVGRTVTGAAGLRGDGALHPRDPRSSAARCSTSPKPWCTTSFPTRASTRCTSGRGVGPRAVPKQPSPRSWDRRAGWPASALRHARACPMRLLPTSWTRCSGGDAEGGPAAGRSSRRSRSRPRGTSSAA